MIRCNICNAQLHHRDSVEGLVHLFTNEQKQIGFANYCLNLQRFDEGWRPTPDVDVNNSIMEEA